MLTNIRLFIYLILFLFHFALSNDAKGQQTRILIHQEYDFEHAVDLFERGIYGAALPYYNNSKEQQTPSHFVRSKDLKILSELGGARASLRLEKSEGEVLMNDVIKKYQPDPLSNQALVELSDYFLNSKNYEKSSQYFSLIPSSSLDKTQRAEVKFKLAYSYFATKKFKQAKSIFSSLEQEENAAYYYPTQYYLGMTEYFLEKYGEAIENFNNAAEAATYKDLVPYYNTQIYFAQGRYNDLIEYAIPFSKKERVRNVREINQLIGQSYFEEKEYAKALPYLEAYAEKKGRLTREAFYQLAMTQYHTQKFQAATGNFEQLNNKEDTLGQYALYFLGLCQLQINKKNEARQSFAKASRIDIDKDIVQESTLYYAKLSYQLGFQNEALTSLQTIPTTARQYQEAASLFGDILIESKDYQGALNIIKTLPSQMPNVAKAHQILSYKRGLQLYQNGLYNESVPYFDAVIASNISPSLSTNAIYWKGDIAYINKDYEESKMLLGRFLLREKSSNQSSEEASEITANYNLGYSNLKLSNYDASLVHFRKVVSLIDAKKGIIENALINKDVYSDAVLRAADGLFRKNHYNQAKEFYTIIIKDKLNDYQYAIFQSAIIDGLLGDSSKKIQSLKNFAQVYPSHELTDDAWMQVATTYKIDFKYTQAISAYNQLINLYPNSEFLNRANLDLGLIYYNRNEIQDAITYYKRVVENNPSKAEQAAAMGSLQEIYIEMGDPDNFISFKESLPNYTVDDEERDNLKYSVAKNSFDNGDYDKSVLLFEEYLGLFPNAVYKIKSEYILAQSYIKLLNFESALDNYNTVISHGQSDYYTKSIYTAAVIYDFHLKDYFKANQYYQLLLEKTNSDSEIYFSQVGLVNTSYQLGDFDQLFAISDKVLINPIGTVKDKAKVHYYKGKVHEKRQDYNASMESFQRSYKLTKEALKQSNLQSGAIELTNPRQQLISLVLELNYDIAKLFAQLEMFDKSNQQLADKEITSYRAPNSKNGKKAKLLYIDNYINLKEYLSAKAVTEKFMEGETDLEFVAVLNKKLELVNRKLEENNRTEDEDDQPIFIEGD